jgi:hypothetical protein
MKKDKSTVVVIVVMAATFIASLAKGDHNLFPDSDMCMPLAAILGLVSAAIAGAASAGVAGSQAKKAKEAREKAQRELDNWYTNEVAGNVLDRADSRSILSEYRSMVEDQNRKFANNAIKGGASEEAKVALNESANKGYGTAISKILAQGQLRKDKVRDSYLQGKMTNANQEASDYITSGQQMANAISKAGSGISSAIGGMELGQGKVKMEEYDPLAEEDIID